MDILERFKECKNYSEIQELVKTLSSEYLFDVMYVTQDFASPDEFGCWEMDIFEACWTELNNRGISDDEIKTCDIDLSWYA